MFSQLFKKSANSNKAEENAPLKNQQNNFVEDIPDDSNENYGSTDQHDIEVPEKGFLTREELENGTDNPFTWLQAGKLFIDLSCKADMIAIMNFFRQSANKKLMESLKNIYRFPLFGWMAAAGLIENGLHFLETGEINKAHLARASSAALVIIVALTTETPMHYIGGAFTGILATETFEKFHAAYNNLHTMHKLKEFKDAAIGEPDYCNRQIYETNQQAFKENMLAAVISLANTTAMGAVMVGDLPSFTYVSMAAQVLGAAISLANPVKRMTQNLCSWCLFHNQQKHAPDKNDYRPIHHRAFAQP
jgi:hypothetical protein